MNFTETKRHILSLLDTEDRYTKRGLRYTVFINTPEAIKIKQSDEGKRLWRASEPRTKRIELIEYGEKNSKIQYQSKFVQTIPNEEFVLHPNEWKKDRIINE